MTAIDSEEGPWREKVPHTAEQSEGDAEAEHDVYLQSAVTRSRGKGLGSIEWK